MSKIIQCVPNISEGKNIELIEQIVSVLKDREGCRLLSVEPDANYNRTVITLLGEPDALLNAIVDLAVQTTKYIDMNKHRGEHPRMGALDVVPFIPIQNVKMKECVALANNVAKAIWEATSVPIYLYEEAATSPERINLADIRRGEFEGMSKKIMGESWKPDIGEPKIHPTAGVTAIGARLPLVAYNITLQSENIDIANDIAKTIRHSNGGFRYIKAGGVILEDRKLVQVTMNITNYKKTSIYRVFETVKMEAKRYGVSIVDSEIVGLLPLEAILDTAAYYLQMKTIGMDKVIESHLIVK